MVVDDRDDFLSLLVLVPHYDAIPPFFGHGVGPVAMQTLSVEVLALSPDAGHWR